MTAALLVIDAAIYRGTVAIVDGARTLAEGEAQMRGAHHERLMPAVADALLAAGMRISDVAGIVCGAGPGSFTSLRIAASLSKGMAVAASVPLYSVSSLLLIVAGSTPAAAPGRYLAVIDAMRGDVFSARVMVSEHGEVRAEGRHDLTDVASAARLAELEGRTMVGPMVDSRWSPHARGVARLEVTQGALTQVDVTAWEPSYGRLAEAQVQWEQKHGRPLSV